MFSTSKLDLASTNDATSFCFECFKISSTSNKKRILTLDRIGLTQSRPKSLHKLEKERSFHNWKSIEYARILGDDIFAIKYRTNINNNKNKNDFRYFESKECKTIVNIINKFAIDAEKQKVM